MPGWLTTIFVWSPASSSRTRSFMRVRVTVALAWNGDAVLIQVTDGSATLPVCGARTLGHAEGDQGRSGSGESGNPGGRGLMLVNAMTSEWGSTRVMGGKTVWAVMAAESSAAS